MFWQRCSADARSPRGPFPCTPTALLLGLSLFVLAPVPPLVRTCEANPVPDAIAEEFRALVRATAETGACPNPALLTRSFGSFGLDLLSREEIASVERRFDVFAPILVDAQRPEHRLNFQIQSLFRRRANPAQQAAMTQVLRDWLTAPLDSAPWSGIVWPLSAVRREIQRARVIAAEMLAQSGDVEAGPLMASLLAPDTIDVDLRWNLERAQECLADSTARTFILSRPDGSIHMFETSAEVMSAGIKRGMLSSSDTTHALSQREVSEIWGTLAQSVTSENTSWGWSGYCVLLEFADGVRAGLSPTEPGHVVYVDNTSLDYRRRLTLKNERLWSQISTLIRREFETEAE